MHELQMLVRNVLLAFPAIALVLFCGYLVRIWKKLPDTVASHFDGAGVPDGWSGKGFFVVVTLIATFGIGAGIYAMAGMHQNPVPIGILYFVFFFTSSMFWLALRANLHDAPLTAIKVLPGALCGLVTGVLAAWSMR
ncbi:MAG: DUF1648 domain-containing protein [Terracidiphilus sp.]